MSENNSLRTCSGCHSTKLEKYFGTNVKGELYKLCDNCRDRKRDANKKYRTKVINKPFEEQYRICDRCNAHVHKLTGMPNHQKTWSCVKTTMEGEPGKKEFYEWILVNKNSLLTIYKVHITEAQKFLNKVIPDEEVYEMMDWLNIYD